jgi:hypothetical protein
MWPLDLPLRNENLPPFTMLTFEFEFHIAFRLFLSKAQLRDHTL